MSGAVPAAARRIAQVVTIAFGTAPPALLLLFPFRVERYAEDREMREDFDQFS